MRCVIFDIDGTLLNCDHRLGVLSSEDFSWADWHARGADDTSYEHMRTIVNLLCRVEHHLLPVYSTGRPESERKATLTKLADCGFPLLLCAVPVLYMRQKGELGRNSEVKRLRLREMRGLGLAPLVAFEDQIDCVKMYRREGVPCFHVREDDHGYA